MYKEGTFPSMQTRLCCISNTSDEWFAGLGRDIMPPFNQLWNPKTLLCPAQSNMSWPSLSYSHPFLEKGWKYSSLPMLREVIYSNSGQRHLRVSLLGASGNIFSFMIKGEGTQVMLSHCSDPSATSAFIQSFIQTWCLECGQPRE